MVNKGAGTSRVVCEAGLPGGCCWDWGAPPSQSSPIKGEEARREKMDSRLRGRKEWRGGEGIRLDSGFRRNDGYTKVSIEGEEVRGVRC